MKTEALNKKIYLITRAHHMCGARESLKMPIAIALLAIALLGTASAVDTTPPNITITSPINGTIYKTSSVPLNYSVNETTAWEGYSLDGAHYVTG